jgi:ankyrin repeat protein
VNTVKRWAHGNSDSCTTDDEWRNTPLIVAAKYGRVEVVRVLLEGGADVQRANLDRHTALHVAAKRGHLEVCLLLLDCGANVNAVGCSKETALHLAARRTNLTVVKVLVERGADVRLKDKNGKIAADGAWNRNVADWLHLVSRE